MEAKKKLTLRERIQRIKDLDPDMHDLKIGPYKNDMSELIEYYKKERELNESNKNTKESNK